MVGQIQLHFKMFIYPLFDSTTFLFHILFLHSLILIIPFMMYAFENQNFLYFRSKFSQKKVLKFIGQFLCLYLLRNWPQFWSYFWSTQTIIIVHFQLHVEFISFEFKKWILFLHILVHINSSTFFFQQHINATYDLQAPIAQRCLLLF